MVQRRDTPLKLHPSLLSSNFLVITPNITVKDRVSGFPRGDGLDPGGARNLYQEFDTVPPEYLEIFHPNVIVRNGQGMVNEPERDDWISDDGRISKLDVGATDY